MKYKSVCELYRYPCREREAVTPSIREAVEVLWPYAEAADSHDPDDRVTNWLRSLTSSPPSPAGEKTP